MVVLVELVELVVLVVAFEVILRVCLILIV